MTEIAIPSARPGKVAVMTFPREPALAAPANPSI